jgi:hypothetical protein
MTHFTRLFDLTGSDESYISAVATSLSPCILRQKADTIENLMKLDDKYSYSLIRDLFAHKAEIFSELKRSTLPEENERDTAQQF